MSKKIIILASGNGSNAEAIMRHFDSSTKIEVSSIISNNRQAGVFDRAKRFRVPCLWMDKNSFESDVVLDFLLTEQPDLIVLAGFLWRIPASLVQTFPNKIINIHPALLPKYGGKGMYGAHIHRAVKESGDTHTGITIHHVNEHYDEGGVIFQAQVEVGPSDTADTIAQKVHQLEHKYFPVIIEQLLTH
jgi:phosphoribosylglycinamide formyltransferase 1